MSALNIVETETGKSTRTGCCLVGCLAGLAGSLACDVPEKEEKQRERAEKRSGRTRVGKSTCISCFSGKRPYRITGCRRYWILQQLRSGAAKGGGGGILAGLDKRLGYLVLCQPQMLIVYLIKERK